MRESPNFGFYKNPRFSVNQLADYLYASDAGQRETIIRSAKFPRKPAVIPYSISKRIICDFLTQSSGDLSKLDDAWRNLNTRHRNEPDGWMQDELKRNIDAIEAFKKAFNACRVKKYSFVTAPGDLVLPLEGVRVSTNLDPSILETDKEGVSHSGGCVMFIASTDQSRRNLAERSKAVAAMVHWHLGELGTNLEPLPRLCLSFDVFGPTITKAPTAIDRLRTNIRHSCREAAARWDEVTPPTGYDGPDWKN